MNDKEHLLDLLKLVHDIFEWKRRYYTPEFIKGTYGDQLEIKYNYLMNIYKEDLNNLIKDRANTALEDKK